MVSSILPIVKGPDGVLGFFRGDQFIPLDPSVLDPTPTPEPTPDPTPTPDGGGTPTPTPTPTPDTGTPTPSSGGIPVIGPDGSVIGEIIDGIFKPIETPTPDPIPTPDGGETPTPDGGGTPTPDGGGTPTPTPTPDGGGTPTPSPTPGGGDISVVLDENGDIIGFIIDGVFRPINSTPTPTPGNVPAPLAVDDQVITNQNQASTFNVLENDIDPSGKPVRVGTFSLPQNGSLVDNGSGSFTYTPRQFYIGPDNFSYSATNGT
ncbi:MAG: Ig-like domain-containing protein, partial [Microcoleaceae cyanobacterium]